MQALAPWLQNHLIALREVRAHAVLLSGAAGMGQFELALALARTWLCEQPGADGACGACVACHAIDVHTHADLAVLMPETQALARAWPLAPKAQDALDRNERKPSQWIRVEAAREAIAFAQLSAARLAAKVILIYPAQRMNVETANTLLKTLEEPPGGVRFILAAEGARPILPTIRSRCQVYPMPWPTEHAVVEWLRQQAPQASQSDLRACLQAAGGQAHAALDWLHSGLTAAQWHAIPQELTQGQAGTIAKLTPTQQNQVLQQLAHDLMVMAAGAAPRFFDPHDLPTAPPWRALQDWQQRLLAQAQVLEHPFNAGLMLQANVADARSVLTRRRG